MAVGFGDAGAEIIADNMRSGGDLNPLVPGQKVTAIFGFCDVRHFTDITEILQVRLRLDLLQQRLDVQIQSSSLASCMCVIQNRSHAPELRAHHIPARVDANIFCCQVKASPPPWVSIVQKHTDSTTTTGWTLHCQEDVMEFVNSIAKIVHMEVSLHGGAANKNVGDAFLLVWKFPRAPYHHHGPRHRAGSAASSAPSSPGKGHPRPPPRTQRLSSLGNRRDAVTLTVLLHRLSRGRVRSTRS